MKKSPLNSFFLFVQCIILLIVVTISILGVWLASSLTAYLGGKEWLVLSAGLLLFPILPFWWDWQYRKTRSILPKYSFLDRLSLRTFVLNMTFISLLLAWWPQTSFMALAQRGDWFVIGQQTSTAHYVRTVSAWLASRLEWLYLWALDNPYSTYASTQTVNHKPQAQAASAIISSEQIDTFYSLAPPPELQIGAQVVPMPIDEPKLNAQPEQHAYENKQQNIDSVDISQTQMEAVTDQIESLSKEVTLSDVDNGIILPAAKASSLSYVNYRFWPSPNPNQLHPIVKSMPAYAESSISEVAKYIKSRTVKGKDRIKALHDYVADRISYDVEGLLSGAIPPQNPEAVFKSKMAVCAGYAALFDALATQADELAVVIVGDAKLSGGPTQLHAWNAVFMEQQWYLMDVTWNSGTVSREKRLFSKRYSTEFLFLPPDIMILNHFPQNEEWQLLTKPLSRVDFLRQPFNLRPKFFAHKLRIKNISVLGNTVKLYIGSGAALPTVLSIRAIRDDKKYNCAYKQQTPYLSCELTGKGDYQLELFAENSGYLGSIPVSIR